MNAQSESGLASDPCQRAFEVSGMTPKGFEETFYAKRGAKDRTANATPTLNGDFCAWFDTCLATRDVHSDACAKGPGAHRLQRRGLPGQVRPLPRRARRQGRQDPSTDTHGLERLRRAPREGRPTEDRARARGVRIDGGETVAGQACQKAITATSLSPRDFWARYPVTQPVKN